MARAGLADHADDALALLDALGIDRAHVVGHSMGGGALWQLLADAPDRLLSASFYRADIAIRLWRHEGRGGQSLRG